MMNAEFPDNGRFHVPEALRLAHEEIRAQLVRATIESGRIGRAAKRAARLCLPHFEQEEEIVFPLFGLLNDLASGGVQAGMAAFLPLISRFGTWHDALDSHHRNIIAAAGDLLDAALKERNREIADLAHGLQVHERLEDEVIYPAAVLIAKHVQEKLAGV